MTLPSRTLRMDHGLHRFGTLPVRTVTIGFEDRPGTDDSILIAVPQTECGYPIRVFCALIGGAILTNMQVWTDITLESGFIRINAPEVTEGQSNYSGWLIVDTISQDPQNPSSHGPDDYSAGNDI